MTVVRPGRPVRVRTCGSPNASSSPLGRPLERFERIGPLPDFAKRSGGLRCRSRRLRRPRQAVGAVRRGGDRGRRPCRSNATERHAYLVRPWKRIVRRSQQQNRRIRGRAEQRFRQSCAGRGAVIQPVFSRPGETIPQRLPGDRSFEKSGPNAAPVFDDPQPRHDAGGLAFLAEGYGHAAFRPAGSYPSRDSRSRSEFSSYPVE